MLQPITLQKHPPRSLEEMHPHMNLKKGLAWYTILGYGFVIGPLLSLTSAFIMNKAFIQSIGIGILGYLIGPAVGILLIRYANKIYHHRRQTVANGTNVHATVLKKGRKFNPFSSTQWYSLTVSFVDASEKEKSHTITSSNRDLHVVYEIGDSLLGFENPHTQLPFFPAQLGYDLTLSSSSQND